MWIYVSMYITIAASTTTTTMPYVECIYVYTHVDDVGYICVYAYMCICIWQQHQQHRRRRRRRRRMYIVYIAYMRVCECGSSSSTDVPRIRVPVSVVVIRPRGVVSSRGDVRDTISRRGNDDVADVGPYSNNSSCSNDDDADVVCIYVNRCICICGYTCLCI
jgi:hypothetical protein